jgi:hypothetical protein
MQFTQGTMFLLTTDLSCSYHAAKSRFLFEFLEKFGKIGFALIEPEGMNGLYELHKDASWKAVSIICNKSMKWLEDCYGGKEMEKSECNT